MEIDPACSKKGRLIHMLVDDTPADITEEPESCSSDGPQLVQVVVTS